MAKNFSERYGFVDKKLLVDEIPASVRASFVKEVLIDFYLDYGDPDLDSYREEGGIAFEHYGCFDSAPLAFLAKTESTFYDLIKSIGISVGKEHHLYKGPYIGIEDLHWLPFWSIENDDFSLDFPHDSSSVFDKVKKIYMEQGEYLLEFFRGLTWYQFFDAIEIIIQTLKISFVDEFRSSYKHARDFEGFDDKETKKFYEEMPTIWFDNLLDHINYWLDKNYIDWQVNSLGKFVRKSSVHLESLLSSVETGLQEEFPAAYAHFLKAKKYCFNRPLDPENAVKEIVTALESLGKTFFPDAKTLTGVRKEWEKKGNVPDAIMNLMREFYSYTNDESGIRHGHTRDLDLKIEDSELCFYLGSALINYMLRKSPNLREQFEKESHSDS
jgi:hypothetical protein